MGSPMYLFPILLSVKNFLSWLDIALFNRRGFQALVLHLLRQREKVLGSRHGTTKEDSIIYVTDGLDECGH